MMSVNHPKDMLRRKVNSHSTVGRLFHTQAASAKLAVANVRRDRLQRQIRLGAEFLLHRKELVRQLPATDVVLVSPDATTSPDYQ
jgi:hypothetical protein